MDEEFRVRPIGVIRTNLKSIDEAPHQGGLSAIEGELVVDERYRDALLGIESFKKLVILYWMHLADRDTLQVHPRRDLSRPVRGVFSTRSPDRPNPIAMDEVEVLGIEGTVIHFRGLDALDGTPLLDIKCVV